MKCLAQTGRFDDYLKILQHFEGVTFQDADVSMFLNRVSKTLWNTKPATLPKRKNINSI